LDCGADWQSILQSLLLADSDAEGMEKTKTRVREILKQSAQSQLPQRRGGMEETTIFTPQFMEETREEVYRMFHDSFDSYMLHAYPFDELKPLSCQVLCSFRFPGEHAAPLLCARLV
jgi:hypothetical protein